MSRRNVEKIMLEFEKMNQGTHSFTGSLNMQDVENVIHYAENTAGAESGYYKVKCSPTIIAYTGIKFGYVCAIKRMKAAHKKEKAEYAERLIKYNSEKEKLLQESKDLPAQELAAKLSELTKKYNL